MKTMTDDKEIVYPKDAKIFQEMLVDLAKNVGDNIISYKNETKNAIPFETKQAVRSAFIKTIQERLEMLIKTENIPEKFDLLNRLALNADPQPAWRPTTGQIPITTLRGKYLEKKKDRLTNKVAELRKERMELQAEIIQRRKILDKQIKQIQKCKNTQIAEMQKANANLLKPIYNLKQI